MALKRTIQTLVYLPHFLSWVTLSGILIDILAQTGIVNQFLVSVFGIKPIFFLGDGSWFRFTIIASDVWKEFGFNTIIFLAALSGINPSLYEAAEVDGAGRWKQTMYITIPALIPIGIVIATLALGNVLNANFDQIFNLYSPLIYQQGDIIDTFVYREGLLSGQFSFATAVNLFKSVISLILIVISYRLAYRFAGYRISRKDDELMYHKTMPYRIFSIINNVLLTILSLLCLLPLYHLLMVSLSSTAPANAGLVTFWPIGFTLEAYAKTFANSNFLSSLWVSVERTVLGTGLALIVNTIAAYALSKETRVFRARNIYLWYFVITMLFSGGLIPGYILILKLGLMNTLLALILPGLVAVFNIILLLNFFRTVPKDLEEAAFIDGAGHFQTFIKIYLPVSVPVIATVSLFMMVGHWNSYFDGIIYIRDAEKLPLATFMQTIIVQADMSKLDPEAVANLSQRTIRASQIFISALPILLVYPFLQRYFVTGIVVGAVKE